MFPSAVAVQVAVRGTAWRVCDFAEAIAALKLLPTALLVPPPATSPAAIT